MPDQAHEAVELIHDQKEAAEQYVVGFTAACSATFMDAERRHEIESLINETEELRRQVNIILDGGDAKYKDADEWQRAVADLTDKITDLATEERDALETRSGSAHKEDEEHDSLMGAVVHLERALEDCNAALDAVSEEDFDNAMDAFSSAVDQLTQAIN